MKKGKNPNVWLAMSMFLLMMVSTAIGRTIYVDADGSAEFDNIQAAIDDSNDGDTIIVADGTYYENINFAGKNIILRSTDPMNPGVVASTIIDGNDANSVVTFSGTESSNCVLTGFTITGGKKGMPLYVDIQDFLGDVEPNWIGWDEDELPISLSADFDDNFSATLEYGLPLDNGDWQTQYPPGPEIADVFEDGYRRYQDGDVITLTFSNLNAGDYCIRTYHVDMSYPGPSPLATFNVLVDGQVVSSGKTVGRDSFYPKMEGTAYFTFTCDGVNDVVIEFDDPELDEVWLNGFILMGDGTLSGGAGIAGNGCAATISKCVITDNLAICGGGLCDCDGLIENNVICDNRAYRTPLILIPPSYGGGLYDCDGLIQNNIIRDNVAEYMGWGGGLYGCDGTIRHNIISNNSADCGGGLQLCDGAIVNNLLVGNSALDGGIADCDGAIRNCTVVGSDYRGLKDCSGTIKNCIVWHNGEGAESEQLDDCNMPSYSCIEDWTGGGTGNTSADPCFANMGYWQLVDEGSWYWWDWVDTDGDYHLKSQAGRWEPNSESWVYDDVTSPCIDGGNPGCPLGDEPNDPNNIRINMGAYGGTAEASKTPANWRNIADLTNDWVVDFNDLKVFVDYWLDTGECIPSDLNRSQSVDFVDFAIFARQGRENNYILLEIYSDGWGGLLETATMKEEGQITILVYEEEPYSYPPARYYVYASRDGYYTEIYYCEAFGSPPNNFITVDVDLDPIVPGKFNGVIFMTQSFFSDRYLPNTDVTVKEGGTVVTQFQTDQQGRFATEIEPGNYYFEFTIVDEGGFFEDPYLEEVEIQGEYQDFFFPDHAQAFKPSIYIYPEETIELDVDIVFPHGGRITTSIPDYNDGWHITVEPSGIIDGQFEYLFYESLQPDYGQYAACWVVIREQLEDFFRNNMGQTGFNQKEIDDFIEYWIPILTEYPYYAIYPQYRGELEEMIKLEFSAQPESLIRLIYSVRGLEDNNLNIQEPVIPPFTRDGFTVTEWGVILK